MFAARTLARRALLVAATTARRPSAVAKALRLTPSVSTRSYATAVDDSAAIPNKTNTPSAEDVAAAHARLQEGNDALTAGNPQLALAKYGESIKLQPTTEALYNAGNVYFQLGRADDAIQCWTDSLQFEEQPDTLVNLANVTFMVKRDSDAALALYDRAVAAARASTAPDAADLVAEIHYNLGCVADAAGSMLANDDPADARIKGYWERARDALEMAEQGGIEQAVAPLKNVNAKLVGYNARVLAASSSSTSSQ
ncbi:hypothetical protein BC828DRAFT_385987 [Blastocladiella britannica]|nr:hypothetical protein BC828DRAFT_385987 [Blastocladiella britannica]